jgi:hypothetical protein
MRYLCIRYRGVAERSNAAVLKTVEPLRAPGVRIPPPLQNAPCTEPFNRNVEGLFVFYVLSLEGVSRWLCHINSKQTQVYVKVGEQLLDRIANDIERKITKKKKEEE